MRYINDTNTICMSVVELASYAFQRDNAGLLSEKYGFKKEILSSFDECVYGENRIVSASEQGVILHNISETDEAIHGAQTEVPLEKLVSNDKYTVAVSGYADIISEIDGIPTVEEIKTVFSFHPNLCAFSYPEHFAQAAVYAYIYADSASLSAVNIRLSYIKRSSGEKIVFSSVFSVSFLKKMFDTLLERADTIIKAFADKHLVLPSETKKLPFPYTTVRDGQLDFINQTYRTIKKGGSLLVSAPTGIGKTISVLFPSVKALGAGEIDRIFYLTAKNITGISALDTMSRIGKYAPHIHSLMIYAKELMCPYKNKQENKSDCSCCESIDSISNDFGKTYISYRERQLAALEDLLNSNDKVYTADRIIKTAVSHKVCPYELALDLSESCEVIICDYNYVIDDGIRFKRYFKNINSTEKYVFLFDEAHNLPDRTRNTYSAVISSEDVKKLRAVSEMHIQDNEELTAKTDELLSALDEVKEMCSDGEYVKSTKNGEVSYGFYESGSTPSELIRCAGNLSRLLGKIIRQNYGYAELLENYKRQLSKIVFVSSFFDEKFRFFASRENDNVKAEFLCLDPSGILFSMLLPAKAVVLFSATLSPIDYFSEIIGLKNSSVLELESPYEKENLCLVAYDSISTKLSDRRDSAYDCAEVIAETVSAREGNYIVYFPSYEYMRNVCKLFSEIMPDKNIVMQKQKMNYKERERFISLFKNQTKGPIVGFCVLGGMFSEGIDLIGESLIGAIVIGTGMPQLSAERNITAAYYDEKNERGRDFAYICPGMNKVMQAAGRVIRSENDCGVIVLVDDRLDDINIKMMLPSHWRHIKYTGNIESLDVILHDFWEKHN